MYIEIDDLIGNAFIPYLEKTGNRMLSLKKINMFGTKVINYLNENGEDACLRLSRDLTNSFFYEYSDLFLLVENENEKENVVILANNITSKDLIRKFSGYLSLPVLLAFRNSENTKVLFEE